MMPKDECRKNRLRRYSAAILNKTKNDKRKKPADIINPPSTSVVKTPIKSLLAIDR